MKKFFIPMLMMLLPCLAIAQEPEEIADQYYEYSQENNWEAIAGLYSPADLKTFRDSISVIEKFDEEIFMSAVFMIFGQNTSPECGRSMMKDEEARKLCAQALRDSLAAKNDAQFLAAAMTQGRSRHRSKRNKQDTTEQETGPNILGKIFEADSTLCHVLYRDVNMTNKLNIVSVKKTGEGWSLIMEESVLRKMDIVKRFKNRKPSKSKHKSGDKREKREIKKKFKRPGK